MPLVSVLTPFAIDTAYTYRIPPDMMEDGQAPSEGSLVRVPLGPRKVHGVIWDEEPDPKVDPNRVRDVDLVFDVPPLTTSMRAFVDWVARYTLSPRGMVLRMALRAPEAFEPEVPIRGVRRIGPPPARLTDARRRVLDLMEADMAWSRSGLAAAAGVSPSVVDGLVAAATLEPVALSPEPPMRSPDPAYAERSFNRDQAKAVEALRAAVAAGGFSVSLLDGVTGSGKTEVYFEAVASSLARGRQALVLLPEIALTSQFLDRFEDRFGSRPAEWHSDVPPKRRARTWRGVATGDVRVVIGARSALFLPFRRLGTIVVDEEHDSAFKQEEGVTYNARDMAVVRGHISKLPVVLASATPSLESLSNAKRGRYRHLILRARASGAAAPTIRIIDMRASRPEPGTFLSPALVGAVTETLESGDQSLLFLNRRGYAPLTLCRSCGHRFECDSCSAWLVEHRFRGELKCHHCGEAFPAPEACPSCGDVDSLVACGPGVERIAEEVRSRFPERHVVVLSSDLPGGTGRLKTEFEHIAAGEGDIVIGTQLVAKGHHFPNMALVGVVDGDLGLSTGDPRAAERTFQLLSQVTGRAGRVKTGGRGFIQTYAPEHAVIRALASGDRAAFYEAETAARERLALPPFGRLAAIILSGQDRREAETYGRALARTAPPIDGVHVLGPAEAPIHRLRGRFRFRLLARAPRSVDLSAYLRGWLADAPPPRNGVRRSVDVDPISFL
ncbi:MAG: primosomal protein N' [Pseudomonadota bacterium]